MKEEKKESIRRDGVIRIELSKNRMSLAFIMVVRNENEMEKKKCLIFHHKGKKS